MRVNEMAEKLTLRMLKDRLDELEARVRELDPLRVRDEGPVIADAGDIDGYNELKESVDALARTVDSLGRSQDDALARSIDRYSELERTMEDVEGLTDDSARLSELTATLRSEVARLTESLEEARAEVTGLRESKAADEDLTRRREEEMAALRNRMDDVFARMVRVDDALADGRDYQEATRKEGRDERLLIAMFAAVSLGVSLSILALFLGA